MNLSSRVVFLFAAALSFGVGLCAKQSLGQASPPLAVERIAVVGSEQRVGVEIDSSGPVTTEAQVLTGPDRLVIDFPGALPGHALRGLRLAQQSQIKAVRAGLFRSNPPVTRVVVDLSAPTAYRLVSEENTVMVELDSRPARPTPAAPMEESLSEVSIERHPTARALAGLPAAAAPSKTEELPVRVGFDHGQLTITAKNASLADVLYQVHLRTGANIPIPSGAEQEKVAIQAGPGPAKEVLATLLNGSGFNFILQGTAQDPEGVGAVILSPKSSAQEPAYAPPPPPEPDPTAGVGTPDGQLPPPQTPPDLPLQPGSNTPPQPATSVDGVPDQ